MGGGVYVVKGCERKYVMGRGFVNVYINISISEKKLFEFYEKYLKIIFHGSTEKNIVHMQLF